MAYALAGILPQAEIISIYSQMTLGALMAAIGVLFTFPNPLLGSIYYHPLSRFVVKVFDKTNICFELYGQFNFLIMLFSGQVRS